MSALFARQSTQFELNLLAGGTPYKECKQTKLVNYFVLTVKRLNFTKAVPNCSQKNLSAAHRKFTEYAKMVKQDTCYVVYIIICLISSGRYLVEQKLDRL